MRLVSQATGACACSTPTSTGRYTFGLWTPWATAARRANPWSVPNCVDASVAPRCHRPSQTPRPPSHPAADDRNRQAGNNDRNGQASEAAGHRLEPQKQRQGLE